MQKKFSFLLAALLMGLIANTSVWAQDYDDDGDDAPDIVFQQDGDEEDGFDSSIWFGPGHGRHLRGMGHGPAMRPGMRGQGMGVCPGMGQGMCLGGPGGRSAMGPGRGMGMGQGMRGRGHGRVMGGFGGGMPMMYGLDLTDAQKTQMVDAMTESFRQRMLLRLEQQDIQKKLRDEYQSDTPNSDVIMSLNRALGELNGKRAVLAQEGQEKFQNLLTPEQREKVKEMKDSFEKMRSERGPRNAPKAPRGPRGPRM